MQQINAAVVRSNTFAMEALQALQAERRELLLRHSVNSAGGATVVPIAVPRTPRVMLLDSYAMMMQRPAGGGGDAEAAGKSRPQMLCPYFEDPLHHRFLDREVVQLLLNQYCGSPDPIPEL